MNCYYKYVLFYILIVVIDSLVVAIISYSYLDRLSLQLVRQQELSQRALSSAIDHTHKIEEASQQQQGLEEELKVLVQKTKRIKELVYSTCNISYSFIHDLIYNGRRLLVYS